MKNAPSPPDPLLLERRRVLQGLLGAGGLALARGSLLGAFAFARDAHGQVVQALAVIADLERCVGCRTCEAACAAFNHPVVVDGERLDGLGNPRLSNMRVHGFIPEVDVPVTCALCADAPCVEACPVPPDEQGRRALYRDPTLRTIRNDLDRCIGCRSCAAACQAQRGGVIEPDPATGKPTRICTLCDGDPRCVKACPYGALALRRGPVDPALHARPPMEIAKVMMDRWYTLEVSP